MGGNKRHLQSCSIGENLILLDFENPVQHLQEHTSVRFLNIDLGVSGCIISTSSSSPLVDVLGI